VYFDVDDADAALARANVSGCVCLDALDYSQKEIDAHLGGLLSRYQECVLATTDRCGFGISLARFEPKRGIGGRIQALGEEPPTGLNASSRVRIQDRLAHHCRCVETGNEFWRLHENVATRAQPRAQSDKREARGFAEPV
jgi:hypothetical protein